MVRLLSRKILRNAEGLLLKKEYEINLSELLSSATEMSPATYQYYKGLKERRIIINDDVSADIIEMAVLPLREMDNDGTGLPIIIELNCYGGDVYSGFCLVSEIERSKSPITINILGVAASMGGLIAMASHNKENVKTTCQPFSVGLIHSGSQYMSGSTHSVRDTFKFSERYEEKIKQYILTHTNISEKMYAEIERQEFWMDSEDMLKYGIVQEII